MLGSPVPNYLYYSPEQMQLGDQAPAGFGYQFLIDLGRGVITIVTTRSALI